MVARCQRPARRDCGKDGTTDQVANVPFGDELLDDVPLVSCPEEERLGFSSDSVPLGGVAERVDDCLVHAQFAAEIVKRGGVVDGARDVELLPDRIRELGQNNSGIGRQEGNDSPGRRASC